MPWRMWIAQSMSVRHEQNSACVWMRIISKELMIWFPTNVLQINSAIFAKRFSNMIFRFWASFWTLLSDFLFCESSLDCYENLELDILLLFALWPTCFIWEVFRTVSPFKNSFFLHNMLLVAYHKTKSKKKVNESNFSNSW